MTFDSNPAEPSSLFDVASGESMTTGLKEVGDATIDQMLHEIHRAGTTIQTETASARDRWHTTRKDDLLPDAGKDRLLREIPAAAKAATDVAIKRQGDALAIIEAKLTTLALAHDDSKDQLLRPEVSMHIDGATTPEAKRIKAIELARDSRYSSLMAGPFGAAIAANVGLGHEHIRGVALRAIATSGSGQQRDAANALQTALPKTQRVAALYAAGRDGTLAGLVRGGVNTAAEDARMQALVARDLGGRKGRR